MNTKLAIIGTSGKGDNQMFARHYKIMQDVVLDQINKWKLDKQNVVLVSGGCSWADHVAVKLFLDGGWAGLDLHLPCEFVISDKSFDDNGKSHWATNPGKVLNAYHARFSRICQIDSLEQLSTAISTGAQVIISNGFHSRNKEVAKSEYMIALTTSKDITGGTAHTWGCSTSENKIHLVIST